MYVSNGTLLLFLPLSKIIVMKLGGKSNNFKIL